MANRYHISPRTGLPNICRAQSSSSCPLGGDDEHFDDKPSAKVYAEKKLSEEHGLAALRKTDKSVKRASTKEQLGSLSDKDKSELISKLPISLNEIERKELDDVADRLVYFQESGLTTATKQFQVKHKVALAMNDYEAVGDNLHRYKAQIFNALSRYPNVNSTKLKSFAFVQDRVKITATKLEKLSKNRALVTSYNLANTKGDFDAPIKLPDLKEFASNVLSIFKRKRTNR